MSARFVARPWSSWLAANAGLGKATSGRSNYVTTALITVGAVGAVAVAAVTATGQLTASIARHGGVLGAEQTALSSARILGAVWLAAAALLIVGRAEGAADGQRLVEPRSGEIEVGDLQVVIERPADEGVARHHV